MIQNLSDAKRLIAAMHNSILESLERKDTEVRRQAIDSLREFFDENNYEVLHKFSNEIAFKSFEKCYDDWANNGKYPHRIIRTITFTWEYKEEDEKPYYKKGWNIETLIHRYEMYGDSEGEYTENLWITIYWSVSQNKWHYIKRPEYKKDFEPKKWY